MTPEPVLVLAWLTLAHLVADFVLQTDGIAADKTARGRRAMRGLGLHSAGVLVALVPFAVAFGLPGLVLAVVVSITHAGIDRAKIVLTRRAEARAIAAARAGHERPRPEASLGTAWTPVPAALFALDQVAHVAVYVVAWAMLLAGAAPLDVFASTVRSVIGSWDPTTFHRVVLTAVVLTSLVIVNVRVGSFFVATLVRPREVVTGYEEARVAPPVDEDGGTRERTGFTFRIGPFVAQGESTTTPAPDPTPPTGPESPARVGATIGVLERLLIVTFVLTGSQAAVGFVVAAKTIARFKQLEDRAFAEYYLLGTLASVSVALGSGLVALAALA